jgi:hypothetical protein
VSPVWAAVAMLVQNVLAVFLVQAEARNRALLAGLLDCLMWPAGMVTTTITVTWSRGKPHSTSWSRNFVPRRQGSCVAAGGLGVGAAPGVHRGRVDRCGGRHPRCPARPERGDRDRELVACHSPHGRFGRRQPGPPCAGSPPDRAIGSRCSKLRPGPGIRRMRTVTPRSVRNYSNYFSERSPVSPARPGSPVEVLLVGRSLGGGVPVRVVEGGERLVSSDGQLERSA